MNLEICKKCPCHRNLIFTDNRERFAVVRRQKFHCFKKVDDLSFEFGCLNVSTYILKNDKWKRIKFSIFQDVVLHWNKSKYIEGLFKQYKVNNLETDIPDFKCPYWMEHILYDEIKVNE